MALHRIHRFTLNLISLSSLAFLVSCAVPLGPSYTIEKQNLAVHFVAQPQAHLEIEAHFQLLASGTQPLDAIEIKLPDEKTFPAQDLRIALDGHNLSFAPAEHLSKHSFRVRFDSPWQPKQRQNLIVQYTGPALSRMGAPVFPAGFVAGGDWYPALLSPKGMFAKLALTFKKWEFEIRVPEDFLVHASGHVRGSRKENGEAILRVQQQTDDTPFIVAGRYQQQILHASIAHQFARQLKDQIVFWTLQPLQSDAAREASMQIARLMEAYGRIFGVLGARTKGPNTLWIVECLSAGGNAASAPSENSGANELSDAVCNTSLPDTLLLSSRAWANGVASKAFQENVNRGLAYLWLGHAAASRTTQDDFSLSGLYAYAAHVVPPEQPQQNKANLRHNLIAGYLSEYDKKSQTQQDQSIQSPLPEKATPLREALFEKSVLFFFAVEDQYGPQHLHRAIARMVHARSERGYNRNDLRSALESETQKNAADFFRRWLDEPGIPEDFRARYENKPNPAGKPPKEKQQ